MKKFISKTIVAIVFVMFLGIKNVNAQVITTCEYDLSGSKSLYIDINDSYTIEEIRENGVKTTKYEVQNWNKGNVGVTGAQYYLKNNQKCPPAMLYAEYKIDKYLYFSDGSSQDKKECENDAHAMSHEVLGHEFLDLYWINLVHQTDFEKKTDDPTPLPPDEEEPEEKHYDDPEVNLTITPFNPNLYTYSCGDKFITGIPYKIPRIGKFIYNFLMLTIPISVVILGSIDLVKGIVGSKEDEIKKGQQTFIKRLIAGAIVFFAFAIVKLVVGIVALNSTSIVSCITCFIQADGSCVPER